MPPAIHADALTGNKVGLNQEQHRFSDFTCTAPPFERRRFNDLAILVKGETRGSQNGTWRYSIHKDVGCEFKCQSLCEANHGGFGRVIWYVALVSRSSAGGQPIGEVDDSAAAPALHDRGCMNREEEGALSI